MGRTRKLWGAVAKWGRYLVNHDGACDYGDVSDPTEIEAYKVPAKENVRGKYQGMGGLAIANNFETKLRGKPKTGFLKLKAYLGKAVDRKQNFEGWQARLAKVAGVSLKGDFEQRRTGRGKAENKATCFECGNTDRFKAQCPIWQAKKKRWANGNPKYGNKGGSQKERNQLGG